MRRSMRPTATALLFVLAVVPGCGRDKPREDLARARAAVEQSLEAWKKGERAGDLQKASPPVRFTDDQWNAGFRLLDYRIGRARARTNEPPSCPAVLVLEDKKGKRLEREVVYQVDLSAPEVVIARDPMN